MSVRTERSPAPDWASWNPSEPYTLGAEEEVMLLEPVGWRLAPDIESVIPSLSPGLAEHVSPETHNSALELATGVHDSVGGITRELRALRKGLVAELAPLGLRVASAGTHPFAVWSDTSVPSGARQQAVYGSMRELARREPTFALHVHVGVDDPESAIRLHNRLRGHIPLLLALSANSPFWQGRDTGLASARTPLFQAFPRVGIPRRFEDYSHYVESVDLLIRCGAFPEPTYLWWDVRPQPRFGTVEVRILDAQTTVADTAALVALVQSIARLEIEEEWIDERLLIADEALNENRFLAARDGMRAELIAPSRGSAVPAADLLGELLAACEPHARALGCADELNQARTLAADPGAMRQLELARRPARLAGLVASMAASFEA
jgi:carboxylate-amine ligase